MAMFGDGRLPSLRPIVISAGNPTDRKINRVTEGELMDPVTTLIVAIALLATADVAAINLERGRRGRRARRASR